MTDKIALAAPITGLLVALDTVPDPVFAERMMGDGFAIDPTEGLVCAPAAATVVSIPDSAHAVTLRLTNGAELLIHIGLETVALAGRGFEAKVRAGDRVEQGEPLIAFDLEAVARSARDLVTPIVFPRGERISVSAFGRLVSAGERIAELTAIGQEESAEEAGEAIAREILVTAPHGLHARPAARIVALLKRHAVEATVHLGEREAG